MNTLPAFPLNGCDTFMLALDEAMKRDGSAGNICHLLVTFSPEVNVSSIAERILRHPVFRSVSSLRLTLGAFRAPRWAPVIGPSQTEKPEEIHWCRSEADIEGEILTRALNPLAQPPFGIALLPNVSSGPSLLFYWHHALCDAHGGEMLVKLLASSTSGAESLIPSVTQKTPLKRAIRRAHNTKDLIFSKSKPGIVRLTREPGTTAKREYARIVFSKDETAVIDARAKQLTGGMFPTALYLAATARALIATKPLGLSDKHPLFVPIPHDMRRTTRQRSPLTNQVSFAFFTISRTSTTSLRDATNDIIGQLHDTIAGEHHHGMLDFLRLIRRIPLRMFWKIIEHPSGGHPASFYFSDIGSSLSSLETFYEHPVHYARHYPPLIVPPGFTTVWSRMREQQEVTICFDKESFPAGGLSTFEASLRKELLSEAQ